MVPMLHRYLLIFNVQAYNMKYVKFPLYLIGSFLFFIMTFQVFFTLLLGDVNKALSSPLPISFALSFTVLFSVVAFLRH